MRRGDKPPTQTTHCFDAFYLHYTDCNNGGTEPRADKSALTSDTDPGIIHLFIVRVPVVMTKINVFNTVPF